MQRDRVVNGWPVGGFSASDVNARTINVNVVNVTQLTRIDAGRGGWHGKKHCHGGHCLKRHGHPPKMLRYCASCGLLDQHVATRMSHGELCGEAANVIGNAAKGPSSNVGNMARSIGGIASCSFGVAKCVVGAVAALFGKESF